MNIYHAWCDLKPGVSDLVFSEKVGAYMAHLRDQGLIEGWRLTRRKLGLGAPGLGEFHLMIEVRDLAQLEAAFQRGRRPARSGGGIPFRRQLTGPQRGVRAVSGLPRRVPAPWRGTILTGRRPYPSSGTR